VARFQDEARLMSRLQHPNICSVFDFGQIGDVAYLAMEVVMGVDATVVWSRLARPHGGLAEPLALFVVRRVLHALDYAHRFTDPLTRKPLGVIHRDVSPNNIMVTFDGEVKLIDFGLARSAEHERRTAAEVIVGRVRYMSPEQARGEEVDARTDQYAAAVVAYELLTGAELYEGVDQRVLHVVAGLGQFVPPRLESLPADVAGVLRRALAGDREKRFATCGEFVDELDRIRPRPMAIDSRALREFLERELDDEKRAARARFALGSAVGERKKVPVDPRAPTMLRVPVREPPGDVDAPNTDAHKLPALASLPSEDETEALPIGERGRWPRAAPKTDVGQGNMSTTDAFPIGSASGKPPVDDDE
jgi:serine/threonine-protein kinase